MRRRFLTIAAGCSLVVGFTVVASWLASMFWVSAGFVDWTRCQPNVYRHRSLDLTSGCGQLRLHVGDDIQISADRPFGYTKSEVAEQGWRGDGEHVRRGAANAPRPNARDFEWSLGRRDIAPSAQSFERHGWSVTVACPHWLLAVMAAILPTVWLVRWRRARRTDPAVIPCSSCGYDLRASPGRCPECGVEAVPSVTAASSRSSPEVPGASGGRS